MVKIEIIALLEKVATPVYQIEENLGMPKTTLQKAIKGERVLPKKWALKLTEAYPSPKKIIVQDLNESTNKVEPEKPKGSKKSNTVIDTSTMPDPKNKIAYLQWLRKNG